jgi:hypothetical protein
MFLCKQCGEQYEDQDLAYTLILESRMNHSPADMFKMSFCSKAHLQELLDQISNQRQRYVLTKMEKGGPRQFEPDFPLELLLLVGSSKAS